MSRAAAPGERARAAAIPAVLLAVLLAAASLIGPARLAAQQIEQPDDERGSQDVAVLADGPSAARGLPFLPPNVIAHYRGRYEYLGSAIDVFYTEQEIVRFSEWPAVDCEGYRLYRLAGGAGNAGGAAISADGQGDAGGPETVVARPVFFYQNDEYALFVQMPQRYLCTFFPRFMSKFIYFRSVQNMPANRPPFPAVVD